MTQFEITFADGQVEAIGADGYAQEGPLTTFFATESDRQVLDAWAVRLASFRTSDLCAIRRRQRANLEAVG